MDPLLVLLFVVLFCLSAFFSGTEIALMWLPSHKVEALIKKWKFWSQALANIKKNNDRLLITILIWNNLVNVYTAALATTIAISLAESVSLPQATAVWIATWVVTFLLLLFWEIIPKSFATKNAVSISLFVAPIYKFLMLILYPVVLFIEIIIKVFSWKSSVEHITDEEIESFIDMWKNAWSLEDYEHEKIKNILEFWDITVEEIMTPRVKIEALTSSTTVEKAKDFYMSHTHSRIPVYNRTIDNIYWVITIRDIIDENKHKHLRDLEISKALKVPLNQPINKLLNTFQSSRRHIAIVIDEYGWVAGLITLEDVIEEIFWEIRDETDREIDEIKENWDYSYVAESWVLMEDMLSKFDLELKDVWLDSEFSWETISYVLTHKLERFPNSWEIVSFEIVKYKDSDSDRKLDLKVWSVKDWKIGRVEFTLL